MKDSITSHMDAAKLLFIMMILSSVIIGVGIVEVRMYDFLERQNVKLQMLKEKNVLGLPLVPCCSQPVTGYFRDGYCRPISGGHTGHIVCATMTTSFLDYSFAKGNDLYTPNLDNNFPGLKAGDCWCISLDRWMEANDVGLAPPIRLESCHEKVLERVQIEELRDMSMDDI